MRENEWFSVKSVFWEWIWLANEWLVGSNDGGPIRSSKNFKPTCLTRAVSADTGGRVMPLTKGVASRFPDMGHVICHRRPCQATTKRQFYPSFSAPDTGGRVKLLFLLNFHPFFQGPVMGRVSWHGRPCQLTRAAVSGCYYAWFSEFSFSFPQIWSFLPIWLLHVFEYLSLLMQSTM